MRCLFRRYALYVRRLEKGAGGRGERRDGSGGEEMQGRESEAIRGQGALGCSELEVWTLDLEEEVPLSAGSR